MYFCMFIHTYIHMERERQARTHAHKALRRGEEGPRCREEPRKAESRCGRDARRETRNRITVITRVNYAFLKARFRPPAEAARRSARPGRRRRQAAGGSAWGPDWRRRIALRFHPSRQFSCRDSLLISFIYKTNSDRHHHSFYDYSNCDFL